MKKLINIFSQFIEMRILFYIGIFIAGIVLPIAVFGMSSQQNINIQVSSSVPYNHCVDGIKNYDETGVDCGGAMCSACGGGGGGGGGGGITLYSSIAFSGKAAPGSSVKILKGGILTSSVLSNLSGDFSISINYLTAGTYNFVIYYEDTTGKKSASITFNITVNQNQNITINNILLPPTLSIDKTQIKTEESLKIFGQSAPNSQITIFLSPLSGNPTTTLNTSANQIGIYEYLFNGQLQLGQYTVKAKGKLGELISEYSTPQNFSVGTSTIEKPIGICPQKGDVNYDCRVNLVDFSITAYWFRRTISPEFIIIENDQLSGDSKIDLVDFSILAYYWTG